MRNNSIKYYFGSARETRFNFETDRKIYDPKTGKVLQDHILILKSNNLFNSVQTLPADVKLNIVGQTTEVDGYPDDFAVEVSGDTSGGSLPDPDFFNAITGYSYTSSTVGKYTFFQQVVDTNSIARSQIIPTSDIAFQYPTADQIQIAKYEFPPEQIFYAFNENKFYISKLDDTASNVLYLVEATTFSAKTGRQGLSFQYKHISSNTMRVDPATSNIIDLYLVTKSYYIDYVNWLADSTDSILEPAAPTLTELTQAYSSLDDYKMISDSLILNSARFKPLFGKKAPINLQSTIKVIRASKVAASDSEIRSKVLAVINQYFSLDFWDFGDTFYFSELSAYIHEKLSDYVSSVILVPNNSNESFGALYEVRSQPDEIFTNAATVEDILVINSLTAGEMSSR